MDEIQITVNKFRTLNPGAEPRRRNSTSKVARLIEEARDTLRLYPDGETIIKNQCRQSWLNHECRNSDLVFRYRKVEGSGTHYNFFDAEQGERGEWKKRSIPLRHDVYVTRKQQTEDRPAVVEACRNMTGFLR